MIDYFSNILSRIVECNPAALSRGISLLENEAEGYLKWLESLKPNSIPVIGITGPPGAGKSTLLNGIIANLRNQGKRIGVLAVDPSSAFTHGSLLGDRIRMHTHFNDDKVYIRSLATRGSLGGLSAKAAEICDLMKCYCFDFTLKLVIYILT